MEPLSISPGRLLYGGQFHDARTGQVFETLNPATGKVLTRVASAGHEDAHAAVESARQAFEEGAWPKMSGAERARRLHRLADLIEANKEELAVLETLDSGKPIRDTRRIDIPEAAACFRYFAGWADKLCGETIPMGRPFFNYTRREPIGVCAGIIPWNFPLLMATWKLAPALATGNTIILKPAPQTPLTALKLGALAGEAGFPPGVVNVVTGPDEQLGIALVRHPGIDKIAFTGSTESGRAVMRESAASLKRLSLELGGKSPNIIFADADLPAAVKGALLGMFYNMGQICTAGSRLLVEQEIADAVVAQLADLAGKLQLGNPLDPKVRMGPLISQEHMARVLDSIELGRKEATLVAGGQREGTDGYFVRPTLFDQVRNDMTIARQEIFGPVLSIIRFRDAEEALEIANDTPYGLSAAVWTRDIGKAHALAAKIRAGTVWINTYNAFDHASPFGGYKQSGFGREMGRQALELYTETKSVWIALGKS